MRDSVVADFSAIPDAHVLQESTTDAEFSQNIKSADFTLLIAPETGGRLEDLARKVIQAGGKLLGPAPEAIRLTSDKLALERHWLLHSVWTPKTWPLGEEPSGGQLIAKPRYGAGSQGITFSPFRFGDGKPEMIVQEFVVGFAASVSFLVGKQTIIPLVPCQQLLSDDGRFQYLGGRLPIEPALAERAIRIATQAVLALFTPRWRFGLCGYIGVDVVLGDDGRDWAIEINPRLTTSYVGLRALSKSNLAEAMLRLARGEAVTGVEWEGFPIQFTADGRVFKPC